MSRNDIIFPRSRSHQPQPVLHYTFGDFHTVRILAESVCIRHFYIYFDTRIINIYRWSFRLSPKKYETKKNCLLEHEWSPDSRVLGIGNLKLIFICSVVAADACCARWLGHVRCVWKKFAIARQIEMRDRICMLRLFQIFGHIRTRFRFECNSFRH